jgi:ribosomal protein S18 acetylase RimI-like enzyme
VGHKIRYMRRGDLPEVATIGRFVYGEDFTPERLVANLQERNTVGVVVEWCDGSTVAGFMAYRRDSEDIEILRLAVHPGWRRLGVGRKMLDNLRDRLPELRRDHVGVNVPERALECQLFLRACGFRCEYTLHTEDSGDYYRMVYKNKKTVLSRKHSGGGVLP